MKRICYLLLSVMVFAGCAGPKRVTYFYEGGVTDSNTAMIPSHSAEEIMVQPDDILAINVSSIQSLLDKNISQLSIYNSGGTPFSVLAISGGQGNVGGAPTSGFLVDQSGNITFPIIGQVKVGGLTVRQVKELMAARLDSVVKQPVVEVRIINYKVTVLGEVPRPGPVLAPNQKISILDAIAAAGDIPINGRKDNVRIIREVNGNRQIAVVNLNQASVFNSPYYYLKQNDIVIVDPVKIRRQENNEFIRFYLPVITSVLSAALAVYGITQLAK
jgi:polysaccharide export outer membrane protein